LRSLVTDIVTWHACSKLWKGLLRYATAIKDTYWRISSMTSWLISTSGWFTAIVAVYFKARCMHFFSCMKKCFYASREQAYSFSGKGRAHRSNKNCVCVRSGRPQIYITTGYTNDHYKTNVHQHRILVSKSSHPRLQTPSSNRFLIHDSFISFAFAQNEQRLP
jgi:hypothetical protein